MKLNKSLWSELAVSKTLLRASMIVFGFSALINVLVLTSPLYMMQVFDRVLGTGKIETLIFLSIIAMASLTVMGLLEGVRGFLLARVGRYFDRVLRDPLLLKAIGQSRIDGVNRRRLVEELSLVRNFFGGPGVVPFFDSPWVPFFLVVIALLHPLLGLLAAAAAVMLFGFAVANDRLSRDPLRKASGMQAVVGEFAGTAIQNADVIHAMGMEEAISQRYRSQIDAMSEATQTAADRSAIITSASKALRIAVQVGVLGLGAFLVTRAELTPGGMIAASIIMGRALAPIEQSIGSWRMFLTARDSYDNIKEFLSSVPPEAAPITLPDIKGRIDVEGVTFRFTETDAPVLRAITFKLEAGTALALVGPSASGKSTLCRLLVGSWKPSFGNVRLDGADTVSLNATNMAESVGYMPQNVELFEGTVKENIARLGIPREDAVLAASIEAGCHEMILRLPEGYETRIGPRGTLLSGGQRQRIGLARALYGDPKLVVLDEPNSNLDQEGEAALVEAIRRRKEAGATLVIVSHRLSMLKPIDKIAVLRNGRLELFGDRDDVLREMAPKPVSNQSIVSVNTGGNPKQTGGLNG